MRAVHDWLNKNHENIVRGLADQVAIHSISTDGEHAKEIERTATLTREQMRQAGLEKVETLRVGDAMPDAYGDWLHGADGPTVFLYAHHAVRAITFDDLC